MIAEYLLLGASAKVAKDALTIEYLKSKQMELSEEEKQQFVQDDTRQFIHFTSEESAKKILQSGFLIPTKGMLKNHFTKSIDSKGKRRDSEMVYMFDSANFSVNDYIRNLPKSRSPFNGCYEYYAISTRPNEYEINNFKRRAQDGAITYEGRLDIDGTNTRLVKYVLGLDEQGEYTFSEYGLNEKYEPSNELLEKLDKDKMGMLRYTLHTYNQDVKKSKQTMKKFKLEKDEYKSQIKNKKDFAKANRQFREEEKEKSYVIEKDGRKVVVKNVEYEVVGGKKLQKVAVIENSEKTKNMKLKQATKLFYMDEYNLDEMTNKDMTEYFFNNLDKVQEKQNDLPEYIGLPLKNIETDEMVNEYDNEFKKYIDSKQNVKIANDKKFDELKKSKKLTTKIKSLFSKIFGKNKDVKLLNQSNEYEDKEKLANLGYASVEAMNKDDKAAKMFNNLMQDVYTNEQIANNYNTLENNKEVVIKNYEERAY